MRAVEPTAGILPIESGKRITEVAWKGLLYSHNARPQKALIGCAQVRTPDRHVTHGRVGRGKEKFGDSTA